jgi:tetratricopeptide (TPR) repeat protein
MKQSILSATGIALAFNLSAQNANVVNAHNYMQDGKLDKAAEFIEPATLDAKTGANEKTWRYRGNIYRLIAFGEDAALKAKFPDALEKAVESYMKAVELDTKGSYKTENVSYLGALQGASLNGGNDAYMAKDYPTAVARYEMAQRIAAEFGQVDTNAIFNKALAYEAAGDFPNAVRAYREAVAAGYNDGKVYVFITSLEEKQGNKDAAIATAKEGLQRFPGNKDLRLQLTDLLIQANRSEEAEASLKEAIAADAGNPNLWFGLGNLYDKMASESKDPAVVKERSAKAEEAYKKAIAADGRFFDAFFNIGVLYNNRAAGEIERCNALKSDTEYLKCKKTADELILQALPFFEQAHALNEADPMTLQQLIKLYPRAGNTAKYEEMKAKLAKLQ